MKTIQIKDYFDNPILLSLENLAGITTQQGSFTDAKYVEVVYVGRTKIVFHANKQTVSQFLDGVQNLIEGVSYDNT